MFQHWNLEQVKMQMCVVKELQLQPESYLSLILRSDAFREINQDLSAILKTQQSVL